MNTNPGAIYIEDDSTCLPYAEAIARVIGVIEPENESLRSETGGVQNNIRIKVMTLGKLAQEDFSAASVIILDGDNPNVKALTQKTAIDDNRVVLVTSDNSPCTISIGGKQIDSTDEWPGDNFNVTYVNKFRTNSAPTFRALRNLLRSSSTETDLQSEM